MASTDKEMATSNSELPLVNANKDRANATDPDLAAKEEEEVKQELAEYNAKDDAMHVDFNEDQWLSCIPGLSLTMATIIFAIIGAGIGVTIALVDTTKNLESMTTTSYMNYSEPYDASTDYTASGVMLNDVYKNANGTVWVDYQMMVTETTIYEDETETLSDEWAKLIAFPGNLWVSALKLLVLPLIILMMVVLPSRVDQIGFIGKRAVPLYLLTSSLAAIQGTLWGWIIQPGKVGSDPDLSPRSLSNDDVTELDAFLNVFYNAFPSNIVSAMANLTILGIIVFFLGIGILLRRPEVKEVERNAVLNFSRAILRCCMMAVVWIVWFTPIGMCSLVCIKIATTSNLVGLLGALGFYILTVLIGHGVHLFLVYPAIFFATTRGNGWKWFAKIYEAPLLAFATSSSAATLPRSLQVAKKAGVRPESYQFILPLGAAINMDGTALGFPIMIALIAQLNSIALDAGTVFVVMVLAVVVSVGTAPIPNAGMVYLTMLFAAAGMSEYAGDGLATLFVLDWFVDRIETAVNVTSDQFVAKIIDDISMEAQKKNSRVKCGCCLTGPGQVDFQDAETQINNNDQKANEAEV